MRKIKYKDIKEVLDKNSLEVKSTIPDEQIFLSLKTISNSSENDLSFFSNIKYLNDLKKIKAKACLIDEKYINYLPNNCYPIIVKDPYLALAFVSNLFNDEVIKSNGIISKNTTIDSKVKLKKRFKLIHLLRFIMILKLKKKLILAQIQVLAQMLLLIKMSLFTIMFPFQMQ